MCNKIIDNEVKNIISRFKQTNNVNTSVKDLTHLKTYSIDDSVVYWMKINKTPKTFPRSVGIPHKSPIT